MTAKSSACLLAFFGAAHWSPAVACPVAADLEIGVIVEFEGGDCTHIERTAAGVVRETEFIADLDEATVYESSNGVLETAYFAPFEEESEFFSYSFPTDNLAPLSPYSGADGFRATLDISGQELERIAFSYESQELREISIGDCSFQSISFQTRISDATGSKTVLYEFLVDLMIPIIVGFNYDDDADVFPPIHIRAAEIGELDKLLSD